MTTYAYCRVSTPQQSIDRQIMNISKAHPEIPEKNYFKESYSGRYIEERKEFQKLLKRVKSGDTIVLDSVSRFSRNAHDGFELYKTLYNNGVHLEFLKEPYINTDVYKSAMSVQLPEVAEEALQPLMRGLEETLMLLAEKQFMTAFEQSQKEVDDLRQRTREGMKASGASEKIRKAQLGARYNTKKSQKTKAQIMKLSKDFKGSLTDREIMELTGISKPTYYKYKKELREKTIG